MRRGVCRALAPALVLLAAGCVPPGPLADPGAPPPLPEDVLIEQATFLLRTGEPGSAYKLFIRALTTGRRHAEALTGAGLALEAQGLLTRAQEYFERAAALAPGSDVAHNNLGAVLYKLGKYPEARLAFRTAFAVSSGRSGIAAANMRLAEDAIEAGAVPPDPAISHAVQRVGSSEYVLFATDGPPVGLLDFAMLTPLPGETEDAAPEAGAAPGEDAAAEAGAAPGDEAAPAEAAPAEAAPGDEAAEAGAAPEARVAAAPDPAVGTVGADLPAAAAVMPDEPAGAPPVPAADPPAADGASARPAAALASRTPLLREH